ncbi:MAG: hypothetical protein ACOC8F_07520 [Planctomycetota bacterium]
MIVRLVLLGMLAAAVVYFAVMAVRRRRRSRVLARSAHECGMRFAAGDPFDIPRRYGDVALISSGHSPRARDVTYGQRRGRVARVFDFRCEAGHATRRVTRHYTVLVAEGVDLADAILWHVDDLALAPLSAREEQVARGPWRGDGDAGVAERLARAAGSLADRAVSMQVRAGRLMLCAPAAGARRGYALDVDDLDAVLGRLDAPPSSDRPSDVANPPPAR